MGPEIQTENCLPDYKSLSRSVFFTRDKNKSSHSAVPPSTDVFHPPGTHHRLYSKQLDFLIYIQIHEVYNSIPEIHGVQTQTCLNPHVFSMDLDRDEKMELLGEVEQSRDRPGRKSNGRRSCRRAV